MRNCITSSRAVKRVLAASLKKTFLDGSEVQDD
jgi:hypothetical protein